MTPSNFMSYPADVLFDIETLVYVAQPERILLLGDSDASFLDAYIEQKLLLRQVSSVRHISCADIHALADEEARFDVAIAMDLFEHVDKPTGAQVLSRLRDVLSAQYCVCLPLGNSTNDWQLNDLFSFALKRVASYTHNGKEYGLFKYNIGDYKRTPDWLNAENWANPNMWNKYRW